jgi:hypothetical protein
MVGYYYSVGNPESDKKPKNFARSIQIQKEFYSLAKQILEEK